MQTKKVAIDLSNNPASKDLNDFSVSSAGAVTYETHSVGDARGFRSPENSPRRSLEQLKLKHNFRSSNVHQRLSAQLGEQKSARVEKQPAAQMVPYEPKGFQPRPAISQSFLESDAH